MSQILKFRFVATLFACTLIYGGTASASIITWSTSQPLLQPEGSDAQGFISTEGDFVLGVNSTTGFR